MSREEYIELGWRRALAAAEDAVRTAPSLDEDGNVLDASVVINALRALATVPDLR